MVITLPAHFDAAAFEALLRELSGDWTIEVDASEVRSASPGGTVSLLVLGHRHSGLPHSWIRQQLTPGGALLPPFHLQMPGHLDQLRYLLGSPAMREPLRWVGYPDADAAELSACIAALAQNVFEHAGGPGWLAVWTSGDGRLEVAVADSGRGFRHSLDRQHAFQWGDRWNDAAALEEGFVRGMSRFPQRDAGSGLRRVRERVRAWDGTISVWSGAGRVVESGDEPEIEDGLPSMVGTQVVITLPGRL